MWHSTLCCSIEFNYENYQKCTRSLPSQHIKTQVLGKRHIHIYAPRPRPFIISYHEPTMQNQNKYKSSPLVRLVGIIQMNTSYRFISPLHFGSCPQVYTRQTRPPTLSPQTQKRHSINSKIYTRRRSRPRCPPNSTHTQLPPFTTAKPPNDYSTRPLHRYRGTKVKSTLVPSASNNCHHTHLV